MPNIKLLEDIANIKKEIESTPSNTLSGNHNKSEMEFRTLTAPVKRLIRSIRNTTDMIEGMIGYSLEQSTYDKKDVQKYIDSLKLDIIDLEKKMKTL